MSAASNRSTIASKLRRILAPALAGWVFVAASPVAAQLASHRSPPAFSETWAGDAAVLSMNAVLGGLTAGVLQLLRGGSFDDGFAAGSLGGGVAYVGKRIAIEPFDGAGFLGREIAAVGGSFVRNAGRGRPLLDELVLPVGPLNLYVRPDSERAVHARLSLMGAGVLVYGIARSELQFDAAASLSAGAPVFEAPDHFVRWAGTPVNGLMSSGVIVLSCCRSSSTFPHERVHVIQDDFAFTGWGESLDGWLQDRVSGGAAVGEYLDMNVLAAAGTIVANAFDIGPVSWLPNELEAEFFAEKSR